MHNLPTPELVATIRPEEDLIDITRHGVLVATLDFTAATALADQLRAIVHHWAPEVTR